MIAIRRILEKKQKEKVEVFNIGTGRGVSVLELINGFEKATGVKLNYQIVGRRFQLNQKGGLRGWFSRLTRQSEIDGEVIE